MELVEVHLSFCVGTELILGKDQLDALHTRTGDPMKKIIAGLGPGKKLRLYLLFRKTEKYINLLVDVQGHQILLNGFFQGDPHHGMALRMYVASFAIILLPHPHPTVTTGNILKMPGGSLGLVDYGQTKSISKEERLQIAQVVASLGEASDQKEIASKMRELGFQTKFDDDHTLAKYAALFFDSDKDAKAMGCATPQLYFAKLSAADPLIQVPDVASKIRYHRRRNRSTFTSAHLQILRILCSICR